MCIIIHVRHNHTLDTNLSNKALHYYTTVLLKCSHTLLKLLKFISLSLNILCCVAHVSYTLYMCSNCANYYLITFIDTHCEHIGVQLNINSSFLYACILICKITYIITTPTTKIGVHWLIAINYTIVKCLIHGDLHIKLCYISCTRRVCLLCKYYNFVYICTIIRILAN